MAEELGLGELGGGEAGVLEEGAEDCRGASAILSGRAKRTNRLQYNNHARLLLANARERSPSIARYSKILVVGDIRVYILRDLSERGHEDGVPGEQRSTHLSL